MARVSMCYGLIKLEMFLDKTCRFFKDFCFLISIKSILSKWREDLLLSTALRTTENLGFNLGEPEDKSVGIKKIIIEKYHLLWFCSNCCSANNQFLTIISNIFFPFSAVARVGSPYTPISVARSNLPGV